MVRLFSLFFSLSLRVPKKQNRPTSYLVNIFRFRAKPWLVTLFPFRFTNLGNCAITDEEKIKNRLFERKSVQKLDTSF